MIVKFYDYFKSSNLKGTFVVVYLNMYYRINNFESQENDWVFRQVYVLRKIKESINDNMFELFYYMAKCVIIKRY